MLKVLEVVQATVRRQTPRILDLSSEQKALLKPLCLITAKPAMFVGNVAEDGFDNNPLLERLKEFARSHGNAPVVAICAKIEAELAEMDDEDRVEFLRELGQEEPGLKPPDSRRVWPAGPANLFHRRRQGSACLDHPPGRHRPQAAGVIHGDFERGFIRAQTIAFEDFIQYKGEQGAKEAWQDAAEGKEYVVKDGDVMNFLSNVWTQK